METMRGSKPNPANTSVPLIWSKTDYFPDWSKLSHRKLRRILKLMARYARALSICRAIRDVGALDGGCIKCGPNTDAGKEWG
jgi:hypothetical protein